MARGHSCPMPLGFEPLHPEGMSENSPGFQPWDRGSREPSPEGTADECCLSRPFGTNPFRRAHPGLKPRAIFICPSGTTTEASLLARIITQILVALDRNVRSKVERFGATGVAGPASVKTLLRTRMSARRLGLLLYSPRMAARILAPSFDRRKYQMKNREKAAAKTAPPQRRILG
jgi:hypothetical protein